jgi:DNA-binding LacI/PurR family transcriptional regulator
MKDVAALTGFSPQTVHRALHAHEMVTPETRAVILRVVKEIGYRPNRTARHLATAKSSILGIVSFATQIYGPAHTILSMDEVTKTLGLNIMLSTVPSSGPEKYRLSPEKHRRAVAEIAGYSPMGMVLLSPVRLTNDFFEDWYHTLPMIVIGECGSSEFASIDHDYASATKEAVVYLIENGHKKIACIKGPPDWTPTRFRYLGWFNGLRESGLPLGPCYEGDWSPQSGYEIARLLIDHHLNDFTAIVVQNDLMAFGVLRALQESGIRVPQDVSVIGYDDMPDSGFSIPPLTTLRQDYEGIGKAAIYNLMSAIRKEQDRKPVLLKCPLIIRGSSGPVFRAKRKKLRTQPSLPDLPLKTSIERALNKKKANPKKNGK